MKPVLFFIPLLMLALALPSEAEVIHYTARHGLPQPMITALAGTPDCLWAGGNRSLAVKPKSAPAFAAFPDADTGKIIAIIPQSASALVAASNGLYRADAKAMTIQPLALPHAIAGKDILFLKQAPDNHLWLGTAQGLFRSQENRILWESVPAPPDAGMIHHVIFSGSLLLLAAENRNVYLFDSVRNQWLARFPLAINGFVTAMTLYGTTLYVGTQGEGIFRIELHKPAQDRNTAPLQSGAFIQSDACNGEIAWFGTFNMLLQINQKTGVLTQRPLPFPEPSSINCLTLTTDHLYVGTEYGILSFPLETPFLSLQVKESVCFDPRKTIRLTGTAPGISTSSLRLDYANLTLASVWFEDYVSVIPPNRDGHFTGQWNITGLPAKNNIYLFRAIATDPQGRRNSVLLPILIASDIPVVALDRTDTVQPEGLRTFTGTFNTPFVDNIQVGPGDMPAEVALQDRKFRATATLKPGKNLVHATLKDWFGRTAQDSMPVTVEGTPSEEAVVVQAGEKKGEEVIVLSEALVFDLGQAEIKPSGLDALGRVADYMKRDTAITASVIGHTDNLPIANRRFANNLELSKSRAHAVFEYLSEKKGLAPDRFTIDGQGDTRPIADNHTETGRRKNRRVEIVLKKVE